MAGSPYAAANSAGRPTRSAFSTESLASRASSALNNSSRTSVLPSASLIKAYIRRKTATDDSAAQNKAPLLSLSLSSPTFLDSIVTDDVSAAALYTIETLGTSTSITRSDPWNGSTRTTDLRWPKILTKEGGRDTEDVLVQMKGARWKLGSAILAAPTTSGGTHKFHIPGYSRSLKWKPVGKTYWCVTASVAGPIAIFDPAVPGVPPKLRVYETLHDKYDSRQILAHHGVSLLLLDYLMVTSLLLVTDIQDWMVVKKYEGDNDESSAVVPHTAPMTSSSQWRKITLGEPIFPRRASSSTSGETSRSNEVPPTPTSVVKIHRGGDASRSNLNLKSSFLERPRRHSSSTLDDDEDRYAGEDDEEDEDEEEHVVTASLRRYDRSRAPSPAAESIYYPQRNGAAPNHNYMDPMFYGDEKIPPVPPLPHHFTPRSLPSPSIISSSSVTTSSSRRPRPLRSLPKTPDGVSPVPEPFRAKSTPPDSVQFPTASPASTPMTPLSPATFHSISRSSSISRRLPVPPSPLPASPNSPSLARRPSMHKPLNAAVKRPTGRGGARSLPPTPISPSAPSLIHTSDVGTERMKSHAQLIEWTTRTITDASGRVSVFEVPPPAYTSINFVNSRGSDQVIVRPPIPPMPRGPAPPVPTLPTDVQ